MWQLTAKLGKRKGRSWPITDHPFVVGRDASCDITLRDPLVSREHCRVECIDGALVIEDLKSSNSTLVNGQSVTRSALSVGDEIVVGEAIFMVTRTTVDEEHSRSAMSLRTTDHIAIEVPALLREVDTESGTLNIRELAQLNALANDLAICSNVEEIFRAVVRCVYAHCNPPELFLAKANSRSKTLTYPDDAPVDAAVAARLECFAADAPRSTMHERRQLKDGTDVITSYIPLCVGNVFVGTFGGSQRAKTNADPAPDVLFAKSIARLVAPFVVAISDTGVDANAGFAMTGIAASFLGESEVAEQARKLIAIAAVADLPVLLQGQTGTGKELAAHLIHELSERATGPLAIANCAAISEELFESELFGHVKGAFTDAISDRDGLLMEANGGHLFLDEIADLSPRNQARILRAIESHSFRPVGASTERSAEFSVIAATNRDLVAAVKAGEFREDLYYRLGGIEICLPPLAERRTDIPLFVRHFADEYAAKRNVPAVSFEGDALDFLTARPWPGNVRELRNSIGKVSSFVPGTTVSRTLLESILSRPHQGEPDSTRRIEDIERKHIEQVMLECGGRIIDAADVLGMHRNTLSKKLKKYNLSS